LAARVGGRISPPFGDESMCSLVTHRAEKEGDVPEGD